MTPPAPAVAGRPTAWLEAAAVDLVESIEEEHHALHRGEYGGPVRLADCPAEFCRSASTLRAALEAHRAAQRQAADDEEAFLANPDPGARE